MSLASRYRKILTHVQQLCRQHGRDPSDLELVVVSKNRSVDEIEELHNAGCNFFAENRLPEFLEKRKLLPDSIKWHFIGRLQRKKVPQTARLFELIQSVDSLPLLRKISDNHLDTEPQPVLLQSNTSGESSKQGLSPEEWIAHISELLPLTGIRVRGLMTMAPLNAPPEQLHLCFARLRQLRDNLQQKTGWELPHLSMGMSSDYPIAIAEGATLLRIGTTIFETSE